MGGSLLHLQGVGQAAVIVAGICHAADDGDGHLLKADFPVQAVHGADEAGGVAGGQLQIVLAHALFVVGIAVEEDVRHGVLLAALENGLDAVLVIVVGLVLGAHAAGGGVQHDVHLLAQLVKGAGHGDVLFREGGGVSAVHQVQIVLHAVGAGHVVFPQGLQGQGGGQIGNADQLHILLHCHAVCQTLADGTVASHAYSDFCHITFLRFHES